MRNASKSVSRATISIFAALLAGGLQPDGFLQPIASFADEFLKAMRPL